MRKIVLSILVLFVFSLCLKAQNEVMMQAFYWNVPTDVANKNGFWWDSLRVKLPALKTAGFTSLWVPPPSKGNWGIDDVGYGIYDHYDLGAYNQKGSVETRYGSKAELQNFLNVAHTSPRIDVFADGVLNHTYGNFASGGNMNEEEANPAVKAYVFGEAHSGANTAYQTSDIKWVIPNAAPGDYYIQIKGYNLPWTAVVGERGYNLNVNWTGATETDPNTWETEPNNGSGQTSTYPGSGITVRAHIGDAGDIDEYKVTLTTTANIVIKLTSMRENTTPSWSWAWADQMYGYYPKAIWYNGTNLANTTLEARTPTKSVYPTHTGTGEANYQWGYADYHPADANDYLTGWDANGGSDAVIPNTRGFGNDFNTYSTTVQSRLNAWGQWMINTIGFDGFRLDFVRGFQVPFVANWIKNLPLNGTAQRYIVGEYWTENPARIKSWITDNATAGATVSAFDFPLRGNLQRMCNDDGTTYNMAWLNHAGMVRDQTNPVSGANISTFVDNHDNAKNRYQWVQKDWKLGYAYILTHEGRPCVLYNHYYGVAQQDWENGTSATVTAPTSLRTDINQLIFARKTYLGGTTTVLTEVGNPSNGNTFNVYVARRAGNGTKSGAIVVLNNANSTQSIQVDAAPTGWTSWSGLWLKNAFNPSERVQVGSNGRVTVQAGARSYAVYVLESEYVAYGTTVAVTGVSLSPSTASVNKSATQQLSATIAPSNASNQTVTWSSNNTAVATVNASGLVTGVAAGTAVITATTQDGGFTATSTITVVDTNVPVTGVSLDVATASIAVGATQQLTATVAPTNATNKAVTWASSNTAVATVSPSGLVTAVAPGTATITVTTTDGAKTASVLVTVPSIAVTGVSLNASTASLTTGTSQQLTATITPTNATNKTVTWSSSNTAVATVSTSGLVSAVAAGTAVITVTTQDGSKTASCNLTVTNTTTSYYRIVNRWKPTTYLYDGGTGQVKYGTSPSSTDASYQWSQETVTGGYVRLVNRATGQYMHIENLYDYVQEGSIQSTWYSAMWTLESTGDGWIRIRNRYQTSDLVHIENQKGYAQHTGANTTWYSAMWQLESVTAKSARISKIDETNNVRLYPNPVSNQSLNVEVSGFTSDETISLVFRTIGGQVAKEMKIKGSQTVSLNLTTGMYFVTIKAQDYEKTEKIIVE